MQQCVLQLQVAIDDALAMAIVYCNDELLEQPSRLRLLDAFLAHNIVKRVATICILHGDAQEAICEEHFLQLHNVWMQ